jgi:transposase
MRIAPRVDLTDDERCVLQRWSRGRSTPARLVLRAKIILLAATGMMNNQIAADVGTAKKTVCLWRQRFVWKRITGIEKDAPRGGRRRLSSRADDKQAIDAVFQLLHSPPIAHGINRTSWRVRDLVRVLNSEGTPMNSRTLAQIVRAAGFRWRHAKVVLTSNDSEYQAKLDRIHAILSHLQPDERFFSIDEYGPFAIKKRGGLRLVLEEEIPKIPQYQTSKGTLLVTAAIELSRNQVTHIYSKAKNTTELLRLLKRLLKQYKRCRTLYFSWDSASWHKSKDVLDWVDRVNSGKEADGGPQVERNRQ